MTMELSNDEKLSAILAEMREAAKSTDLFNGEEVGEPIIRGSKVEDWADRIEAAVKRACIEAVVRAATQGVKLTNEKYANTPIGNIAAIRKALEMFVKHASCLHHCDIHRFHPNTIACNGVLVDGSECSMKPECDAVFAGRAALAKLSRNCDRFVNELDAQLAFLNEVWLISVDKETMLEQDKYESWTDEMRKRYGRWLYARATEKEGGNGGSK